MAQQQQNPQALARQQVNTLAAAIADRAASFAAVAPKFLDVTRMVKLAQAAVSRTPKLGECTPLSVLSTLMRAAELGLEPNSPIGGMWLVPFKNKRTGRMECQGIIDYRGFIDLARRSGELAAIFAEPRYAKDEWHRTLGTDPKIHHVPAEDEDRGDLLGFYAVARLRSGEVQFAYMSVKEVNGIRARSRSGGDGPWATDYNEMGKKTVLRRLCKMLPLSSNLRQQLADEEAVEAGDASPATWDGLVAEAEEVAEHGEQDTTTASSVEKALNGTTKDNAPREPGQEG